MEKLFYTIGEVAELTNVPAHVLRYWEKEFGQLRPRKDRSGFRRYQQKDIEMVLKIRKFLYQDRFTIEGAKKRLNEERKSPEKKDASASDVFLFQLREELKNIQHLLQEHRD